MLKAYCILYKPHIVEIWYKNVYYYVTCLYFNDSESINHYHCAVNEKCPSCYHFVSGVTKMSFLLLSNTSVLSHVLVAIDSHEWLQRFTNGQQIIILSEDERYFI
jgi:hypothetical protein